MFSSILLVVFFVRNVSSVCDRNTGPSGSYDCFLAYPQYTGYQWGTCLSDAYIEQSTSREFACVDQTRTHCYYPCMLDLFKIVEGPVYDACACNPNSSVTASPMSTLERTCYSPTGEDCSWYTNCLAERYPCTGCNVCAASTIAARARRQQQQQQQQFLQAGQIYAASMRSPGTLQTSGRSGCIEILN